MKLPEKKYIFSKDELIAEVKKVKTITMKKLMTDCAECHKMYDTFSSDYVAWCKKCGNKIEDDYFKALAKYEKKEYLVDRAR